MIRYDSFTVECLSDRVRFHFRRDDGTDAGFMDMRPDIAALVGQELIRAAAFEPAGDA